MRNARSVQLVEEPWEGATTMAALFEQSCKRHSQQRIGHNVETRAAIFSETRAEWFIALQGCFRHNITVVTIYASLGEDALIHSINEARKIFPALPMILATGQCPHFLRWKNLEEVILLIRVCQQRKTLPSSCTQVAVQASQRFGSCCSVHGHALEVI
ncbi:UNVERIFIED_CONTAM: Long chain acyl-CoA synthetase 8 [Sesamum radiatum]|uniref:Long chain acyl-CoA synthetase 8 n=1 Tax=Sesamum radiatum TaxID=300843 RepID=A0AAW2J6Z2_SESRA